jgi:peptide chain release factor subunit 1
LDPLREVLEKKETYGLLIVDRRKATIATLRGSRLVIHHRLKSRVHGKHGTGGQSQRRYEEIIEQQLHEFLVKVVEYSSEAYLAIPELKGLFIGGSGFTKETFAKEKYLDYRIQEKILDIVGTSYAGKQGLKEMIEKI